MSSVDIRPILDGTSLTIPIHLHMSLSTLVLGRRYRNDTSILYQLQQGSRRITIGRAQPVVRGHCSSQIYTGLSSTVCRVCQSLIVSVLSSPLRSTLVRRSFGVDAVWRLSTGHPTTNTVSLVHKRAQPTAAAVSIVFGAYGAVTDKTSGTTS